MSKRFGRNQRRKMLQAMASIQASHDSEMATIRWNKEVKEHLLEEAKRQALVAAMTAENREKKAKQRLDHILAILPQGHYLCDPILQKVREDFQMVRWQFGVDSPDASASGGRVMPGKATAMDEVGGAEVHEAQVVRLEVRKVPAASSLHFRLNIGESAVAYAISNNAILANSNQRVAEMIIGAFLSGVLQDTIGEIRSRIPYGRMRR